MSRYVLYCGNDSCIAHNTEFESGNFRLKYKAGKMVPEYIGSPVKCPFCGKELLFRECEVDTIPSFSVNDFASLSDDQKKAVLKKRYQEKMTSSSKDEVESRKKSAISKMIGYEK